MTNSERELISERRRLLENPYAFVEQLEAQAQPQQAPMDKSASGVSASRRLLENPYAYLDGDGGYAVHPSPKQRLRPTRWTNDQIEAQVRQLHARLWRERGAVWGSSLPPDPVEMLDPVMALGLLGFDFALEEGLGQMPGSGQIEVAGLIDMKARLVRVGSQFSVPERTFTAAHELGHAMLHPEMGALHRDRPLDGSRVATDRIEVEANKFATLFLMPEKLVRARFREVFQSEPFDLSEETAFALLGCSLSDLLRLHPTRRQLARVLASTERFNGRHIVPLHQQFRISREAMAIRLEELALVPVDA